MIEGDLFGKKVSLSILLMINIIFITDFSVVCNKHKNPLGLLQGDSLVIYAIFR